MLRIGIDIREERLILVNRGELNFDFHADSRRPQRPCAAPSSTNSSLP